MNKLQSIEFEILKVIIDVCDKLNLQYFLVCGSALGAVKYNGFIPWDDDIDIALPRKDYSILVNKVQEYLPEHLFFQNYKTEKGLMIISSKIRDLRTTYIEYDHCHLKKMKHGVFVDIIPLDNYLKDSEIFAKKFIKFNRCRRVHSKSNNKFKDFIKTILKPFFPISKFYLEFEKYLLQISKIECQYYCNFHNSKNGKLFYPIEVYGNGTIVEFNGLKVRVPEKYDEYLTGYYGDWRSDPPVEEQVGHHYAKVIDLEHPYTDYIKTKK